MSHVQINNNYKVRIEADQIHLNVYCTAFAKLVEIKFSKHFFVVHFSTSHSFSSSFIYMNYHLQVAAIFKELKKYIVFLQFYYSFRFFVLFMN